MAKQRPYIDANAGVGRMSFREPPIPYKVETLLDEMEYCRIHATLVYGNVAKDYSFTAGNGEVLSAMRKSGRLFGVAAVIPDMKYELAEGSGYLDMLADSGVRAFKLFPMSFSHEFSPFMLEGLAEYMVRRRLPLVIDAQQADMTSLRQVLQAFPDLNALFCGTHWSGNRDLFRLMEKFGNLHFELSCNQANDILAVSQRHFGLDRVLFGTGYPAKSPGALKALVEYSGLCETDKEAVAAGNAARLFGIDLNRLAAYDENDCRLDTIARKMDAGLPLAGELVIDPHAHMVDANHRAVSTPPIVHGDADSMIAKMDLMGVDTIITSPWEGLMTGEGGNLTALRAHEKHGGRIEGYVTWNPNYPEDLDEAIGVYHEQHRFPGLKPYYPFNRVDLLDARYDRWFEYGNAHGLFMLVHIESPETSKKVDVLAARYPNMAFLMAHSGQSYEVARSNVAVANAHPNVYLEITFTALTFGIIEFMVREAGADKVLYGSDAPMRDPAPQLAWVCYAKITEEDKRKILGGNMKKLLDRCYR